MNNNIPAINVAIVQYPGAMQSAVEGLRELFGLANRLSTEQGTPAPFHIDIQDGPQLAATDKTTTPPLQVIILPPCIDGAYYTNEHQTLTLWLQAQHEQGAVLCSVCAGAFILAQTGLLDQRPATTHWLLAERFSERFPAVYLDDNKILINDGDLITAGGLMAWLDLGLELVAQFVHPALMRQLGKQLVVDTGPREQRYYRRFIPRLNHGDSTILKSQHHMQRHFRNNLSVKDLAIKSHLTERTFLRRFVRATGLKPSEYLQQLRVSKACDALESSQHTVENIASEVGYEDVSAFRKVFLKTTGLTPRDFRTRFGSRA